MVTVNNVRGMSYKEEEMLIHYVICKIWYENWTAKLNTQIKSDNALEFVIIRLDN